MTFYVPNADNPIPGQVSYRPAVRLTFEAIQEPWQDVPVVTAQGRPTWPAVAAVLRFPRVAVLTDSANTPGLLASRFLDAGVPDCRVVVGECLGRPDQRVTETTLSCLPGNDYDPLSVLLVLQGAEEERAGVLREEMDLQRWAAALSEREAESVILSRMRLAPGETGWALGVDAHSIARALDSVCPGSTVLVSAAVLAAVELDLWPRPSAVFLGERTNGEAMHPDEIRDREGSQESGSGGPAPGSRISFEDSARLIHYCARRLLPDGRLVIRPATPASLQIGLGIVRAMGWAPHVSRTSARQNPFNPLAEFERDPGPVYVLWSCKPEDRPTG